MFAGENEMLPERQDNRMTADVVTVKTEALGWKINYGLYKQWVLM